MSPEAALEERELAELHKETLASLPRQCRRIYIMVREDRISYDRVAARLGLTRSAVSWHIVAACDFSAGWRARHIAPEPYSGRSRREPATAGRDGRQSMQRHTLANVATARRDTATTQKHSRQWRLPRDGHRTRQIIPVLSWGLAISVAMSTTLAAQQLTVRRTVNLRSDASTLHPSIRQLSLGDTIQLVTAQTRNDFLRVRAGRDTGWVFSALVELVAAGTAGVPPALTSAPQDYANCRFRATRSRRRSRS
jgi:hypothetical protein